MRVMKKSLILTMIAVFVVSIGSALAADVSLNVLEWEGYISPFKDEFIAHAKKKGMDVDLVFVTPYITTPEDIFVRMRSKKADVVTPTNNYYKGKKSQLLKILCPIDYSKLPNYTKVLQSLREAKYDELKGAKYSVPLLGGSYGLAYNANTVKVAPDSWEILWADSSKGKFAVTKDQYAANLYITQLVSGVKPELFYDIDKSKMDKAKIQAKLDALVKNAGSFWGGVADAEAMKNLDYVTTYWFAVAEANGKGQNWKMASPKEGQTVWLDTMAIGGHVKGDAKKLEAAHMLLDFMISDAIQKRLLEMYGSVMVNADLAKQYSPEEAKAKSIGDASFFKEEFLWQPLTTRTQNTYKKMWDKAMKKR